jgi:hypothetical protein
MQYVVYLETDFAPIVDNYITENQKNGYVIDSYAKDWQPIKNQLKTLENEIDGTDIGRSKIDVWLKTYETWVNATYDETMRQYEKMTQASDSAH